MSDTEQSVNKFNINNNDGLKQRHATGSNDVYSTPVKHTIDKSNVLDGLTDDGIKFHVPDTLNTVNTFLPVNIGIASFATIILLCCSAYSVLFLNLNKWYHIIWFMLFRVSYDVGLGILLRQQSQFRSITKWYIKQRGYTTQYTNRTTKQLLFDHIAAYQLHHSVRNQILSYPIDFRAWLVYKSLVNFILVQDGLNYLLLALKLWKLPNEFSTLLLVQYGVGIMLSVFNFWAKQDAHRCIGEYSWYWGDFFFRKQADLVFDGIFELFPHPMYTVGYSLYYGLSLLSRSYTLLFVSLTAHAMQLIFLFVVEEPHIERTYGKPPRSDQTNNRAIRSLYHTANNMLDDSVFFYKLNLTRPADISLIIISLYCISTTILLSSYPLLTVLHVLLWRAIHWLGIGTLLWLQSTRQWLTRRFLTRGYTLADTFTSWKGMYNISYTTNLLVFICCSFNYMELSSSDLTSPSVIARIIVGLILITLNIWSYISTYTAVGNFGWYYGDFFIQQQAYTRSYSTDSNDNTNTNNQLRQAQQSTQQTLCYTGIYRFLNNPDCITGYMGLYGTSLICRSFTIFVLALISHACQLIFLYLVEIPHMNRLYSSTEQIRSTTPAVSALNKLRNHVTTHLLNDSESARQLMHEFDTAEDKLKQEIRKIRLTASSELLSIYKRLAETRQRNSSDIHNNDSDDHTIQLNAVEQISVGDSLYVDFTTDSQHSDTDWIGVYSCDTPSVPSSSDGRWLYVPIGSSGTIYFPSTMLPQHEGIYEIRYHKNNQYDIVKRIPLIITNTQFSPRNINESTPRPSTHNKLTVNP